MSAISINKSNFESEILKSQKKVLLDFYSERCGPCRMISPVIDQIASEHPEYTVGKINVDEQSDLASEFQVMSIPALFVLENGKVINRSVGAKPKAQILAMLQ